MEYKNARHLGISPYTWVALSALSARYAPDIIDCTKLNIVVTARVDLCTYGLKAKLLQVVDFI